MDGTECLPTCPPRFATTSSSATPPPIGSSGVAAGKIDILTTTNNSLVIASGKDAVNINNNPSVTTAAAGVTDFNRTRENNRTGIAMHTGVANISNSCVSTATQAAVCCSAQQISVVISSLAAANASPKTAVTKPGTDYCRILDSSSSTFSNAKNSNEKDTSQLLGLKGGTVSGARSRTVDGHVPPKQLADVSNCVEHSGSGPNSCLTNSVLSASNVTIVYDLTMPTVMTSTPVKINTRNNDIVMTAVDDVMTECDAMSTKSDTIDAERHLPHKKHDAARECLVDIDGLPLNGGRKRLNLKLLLQSSTEDFDDNDDENDFTRSSVLDDDDSNLPDENCYQEQEQQKEDTSEKGFHLDDYEFPDEDEDKDRRERRLYRKSSLRSVKSDCSQDSVTSPSGGVPSGCKKFVTFADSLGIGLADIRALLNSDEPPFIPCSALRDLNIRRRRTKTEGLFTLWLDFEPPSARPDFVLRLLDQKVVLENCMATDADLSVCGLVRVYNIAFDKRVFIRYTLDNWHTEHDVLAAYVPESSDGTSDRFIFNVRLPDGFGLAEARQGRSGRIEFALCYCAGTDTYWDNNDGANYVIFCRLLSNMEPL